MKMKILRDVFVVLLCAAFGSQAASALPMGPREVAHFEREAVRVLRELFSLPHETVGDTVTFRLRNQVVRETNVESAVVEFDGLSTDLMQNLTLGCAGFDEFKAVKGVRVEARFREKDIQALIDRELARQKSAKPVFRKIVVSFGSGSVAVSGEADLTRVPGNPFAFIPQDLSPFSSHVALRMEAEKLMIDILDAQVNGQPMTPELKSQVLSWLNPLWDFSLMPYEAGIDELSFLPGGFSGRGHLFAP